MSKINHHVRHFFSRGRYPRTLTSRLSLTYRRTIILPTTLNNLPLFAMIILLLLLAPTALAFVVPFHRYRIPTTNIKSNPPLFSSPIPTNDNWNTCAQPRFDEFAYCIVGPWSNINDPKQQDEVEEVMRSCGGKSIAVHFLSFCISSYYISTSI